jgi:hypothetical protein
MQPLCCSVLFCSAACTLAGSSVRSGFGVNNHNYFALALMVGGVVHCLFQDCKCDAFACENCSVKFELDVFNEDDATLTVTTEHLKTTMEEVMPVTSRSKDEYDKPAAIIICKLAKVRCVLFAMGFLPCS